MEQKWITISDGEGHVRKFPVLNTRPRGFGDKQDRRQSTEDSEGENSDGMSYRDAGYVRPIICSSSIKSAPFGPTLLGLPTEIRLCVYRYLIPRHVVYTRECSPFRSTSIIRTCRQLYAETVPLLYKGTTFIFTGAEECSHFLNRIGYNIKYLYNLHLSCNFCDGRSIHLGNICFKLRYQNLKTLCLTFERSGFVIFCGPPAYIPSEGATLMDVGHNVSVHSIGDLTGLRDLEVVGRPETDELEYAVIRLSVNMKNTATFEGREVEVSTYCFSGEWNYRIRIGGKSV
ncbi:hypothetical protein K469DRAFT_702853 [Zopfia rhizophila CBS 207.26]|uniref:F-box domain-containing protein n=1 Tax=Zopfia rhizophila CBS 207.26 TaxID=1314779 RepID=A0A6A6EDX0_9PEZI|nr:hypothetical protein K469DRAFT_702440 [Zopfia rhizophila CBS 207.26]KAF2189119.1 hypothetical protein K469DRAFT_702853 [Zopfia rhizophila CBS 207.26]